MVLGIETSCDETGVALVSDGWTLIASKLASQIDVHRLFGGVVPEVASRQHLKALGPLVEEVLAEAGVGFEAVSAVGVCNRPGLVGALVVGVAAAKAYALALDVPIYGVDHLTAHCAANYLVEGGIKGIINFAPARISVPENIPVEYVDFFHHLYSVAFEITLGDKQD